MPTPTEVLTDLKAAFEALYTGPVFSAVQDGENEGDKYISATIDTDYELRVDYRVNGNDEWMNNWTVTCTDPTEDGYPLNTQMNEDATDTDLLTIITDYIAAMIAEDTALGSFVAEFVEVVP